MKKPSRHAKEFSFFRNGKYVTIAIPKNNHKPPRTKRLRKKKFWFHCGDCKIWFKRYTQTHGEREDGKKVCHECVRKRIRKARPDLFQHST